MEKVCGDWLNEPQLDMTWINVEKHLNKEWSKLQKLKGPTIKSTTYQQQANLVTKDVLQAMQRERVLMLQQNRTHKNDILKAL